MVDTATTSTEAVDAPASSAPATPLELIREKEAELSGRVLSAKREADEIVSDARKQAAAIIEQATEESVAAAKDRQREVLERTEAEAKALLAQAESEAAELSQTIEPRIQSAVDFVLNAVIGD